MTAGSATVAPELDELIVNKRQLSRLMGISEPTIDRWIDDGCPVRVRGSNGVGYQFVHEDVIAWRKDIEARSAAEAKRVEDAMRAAELELTGGSVADGEIGKLPAKERSAAIDAEFKAMKLAQEKGQLMERDEVLRDYQAVFGLLRQRLLSMPNLLSRIAQLDPTAAKIMDKEMRSLLHELSRQIRDPALRPQSPDSDPETGTEDSSLAA